MLFPSCAARRHCCTERRTISRHDAKSALQVAAAVIRRDDAVLVCQRASGSPHAGKWEFPGGKREPGESLEACLRRELEEELAMVAEIGRLLATTRHYYAGRGWVELSFFEVGRFDGVPTNLVFAEICWQPIERLGELDFLEADREFIRRLSDREVELRCR